MILCNIHASLCLEVISLPPHLQDQDQLLIFAYLPHAEEHFISGGPPIANKRVIVTGDTPNNIVIMCLSMSVILTHTRN